MQSISSTCPSQWVGQSVGRCCTLGFSHSWTYCAAVKHLSHACMLPFSGKSSNIFVLTEQEDSHHGQKLATSFIRSPIALHTSFETFQRWCQCSSNVRWNQGKPCKRQRDIRLRDEASGVSDFQIYPDFGHTVIQFWGVYDLHCTSLTLDMQCYQRDKARIGAFLLLLPFLSVHLLRRPKIKLFNPMHLLNPPLNLTLIVYDPVAHTHYVQCAWLVGAG